MPTKDRAQRTRLKQQYAENSKNKKEITPNAADSKMH